MAPALALAEATDLHRVAFHAAQFKNVIADQLDTAETAGALPAWSFPAAGPGADSAMARAVSLLTLALPGAIRWRTEAPCAGADVGPSRADHGRSAGALGICPSALAWRTELQTFPQLQWEESTNPCVLHFSRPHGWHSVTNFGPGPALLPKGIVVVTSRPTPDGVLGPATTAWLLRWVG
ncbi:hypothetical protein SPF06_18405 [Sinomonas sp. JGH33]|uniref:Beta-lactamase-related domain-containing protein n=1 Tax=Sinomonas terricola TaxID=3110330 RepID=A0ABU5TAK8_9MICC|nr:hypothetical protein [Sinomonas sp. JGH33]MEA5456699.1 hypothetical protein [Sinomonas sp. JGH33]